MVCLNKYQTSLYHSLSIDIYMLVSVPTRKIHLIQVSSTYWKWSLIIIIFFQEDDKDKHTSTTSMFCVTLDCTIINIKTSLFSFNFQMNFIAIALDNHTVYLEEIYTKCS